MKDLAVRGGATGRGAQALTSLVRNCVKTITIFILFFHLAIARLEFLGCVI